MLVCKDRLFCFSFVIFLKFKITILEVKENCLQEGRGGQSTARYNLMGSSMKC